MAELITRIFSFNLVVLRFLGLYGPINMTKWYKLKGWIFYIVFVLPIPVFGSLNLFLQENLNIIQEADNIFTVIELSRCIAKVWPFLIKRSEITKCILFLNHPKFEKYYNSNQGKKIFENSRIIFQSLTKSFTFLIMFLMATWWIKPFITKGNKKFPVDIYLPFEALSVSYFYLIPINLFILCEAGYTVAIVGVSDTLIAGLAYQATSHLKLLKYNLKNLAEFAELEVKDEQSQIVSKKNKIIYERIKHCINHHTAIIKFSNYYEDTFSSAMFVNFILSAFVVCFACFQMAKAEPFTYMFFTMIMYIVGMLAEIFFYCFIGHTLTHESDTLTTAIYMGNWYEYDLKSQKALLIFMERAKTPIVVKAGKLLDCSINTFTSIIRKSYSLLAFLNNFDTN